MDWQPDERLGRTFGFWQFEEEVKKRVPKPKRKSGKVTKPLIIEPKRLKGKHPVSLLGEYCAKRKIGTPIYELCFESGPDHKKNFVFKVTLNTVEYKPSVPGSNKREAKALAAITCLQALGLLPEPKSKTVEKT